MALRTIQARGENGTKSHALGGKSFLPRADVKPRAALGSIGNIVVDRKAGPGKISQAMKKKPLPAVSEPEMMEVGQLEDPEIDDIDAVDADNPQLCAEYVKDIYQYMQQLERKYHVKPEYLQRHPQINAKMRAILVDWLVLVHQKFTLLQETLFLTISIIDRYLELEIENVDKSRLQLVGVTAMLIASKYEEMYAPEVRDFVYITDNTYSSLDIRDLERHMLRKMEYSFGTPLCIHFLRRFSRAGQVTPEIHTMGKFLMELCLPDYKALQFLPSQQAAAALYLAMKVYDAGDWSLTLQHYSGYSEEDVLPCMRKMAQLLMETRTSKQQAVMNKYSSSRFFKVAKVAGRHDQIKHLAYPSK